MRRERFPRRGRRWSRRDEGEQLAFWPLAPLLWTLAWITFVLLHGYRPSGEVVCTCGGPRLLLPSAAFGSEELRFGPVVEVLPDGLTLDGEPLDSPSDLEERLVALRRRAALLGRSLESLSVAADAGLPAGAVKAVLASAAAAGVRQADLAVWRSPEPSAPPAPFP